MQTIKTQLLIIGGGPGGYVAALRAAQLGLDTTLVERQALGGTCLNVGCIPSKALIHVAEQFHQASRLAEGSPLGIKAAAPSLDLATSIGWKNAIVDRLTSGVAGLLNKGKVRVLHGEAQILDGKHIELAGQAIRVECEHLLLATGSETVPLPSLPLGGAVISSTEALAPTQLPRHLCVVGAGYIGLELGTAYRKLGVRVSIIEALEHILPSYDPELTHPVAARLKALGIDLYRQHRVQGYDPGTRTLHATTVAGDTLQVSCDQVLVAVGRKPRTAGLESLQLAMHGNAVAVDRQCRTSMRNVWAIGDLTGEPMLAHRAMAQGEMVAEIIAGKRREFVPAAIPAVCFTDPELLVAGLTPAQAQRAGLDCISAQFPFAANGRAMTLEASSGFVRVVARRDNHLIVGWQAVGVQVSELASAFSQSLELGATLEDIAGTVHAHPTLGEAVQEAALRALGRGLHL
ncbi:dihydrolipoyl dehydrogenase [Pseudomonas sp. HR96]|uniref:dihydrolipoyl dehydrogenase n=1 Tax=Pseudomonas sp. HR96 TaxID=1027966 RepID=UPI002A75233B|nr:dihydrolipoyl dehydrogenase [Pseudomonas sp. HR96]WPO97689.1 dihydrolipoyl dehydrogenase [Pseudomonas sp. HR96]